MELARCRPGIQLRRLEGVPGRESGAVPGTKSPAALAGRLLLLLRRPRLWGRSGELGAESARSWLTSRREGGNGRGPSRGMSWGPGERMGMGSAAS